MSRKKFRKKDRQAIVDAEQEIDDDLREEITRQVGRRDFLKKAGTLAGVGAVGVGLGSMLGHSLASPGAGAGGTTISDEDIDAKRIGGVRYAADFITGTVPAGTDADPYPGSAIQAAIDDLPSRGGIVVAAAGIWEVDPNILTLSDGQILLGQGYGETGTALTGTVIRPTGVSANPILKVDGTSSRIRGFGIGDIMFDCLVECPGIDIYRGADFFFDRVIINDADGYGLQLRNVWDGDIRGFLLSNCGSLADTEAALEIQTENNVDNCNSLHFSALRIESSNYSCLAIRGPVGSEGGSNHIQFLRSKFHLPEPSPYSLPDVACLLLEEALAITFMGCQIFDGGASHGVIEFTDGQARPASYSFYGCEIRARTAPRLVDVMMGESNEQNITMFGNTFVKDGNHAGSVTAWDIDATVDGTGFQGKVQELGNDYVDIDTLVTGKTQQMYNLTHGSLRYYGDRDFEIRTDTNQRIVFYLNGAQAGYFTTSGELVFSDKRARFGYVAVTDGMTAPGTLAGEARIYVDTADGDLKVKFADGTVKTIVTDT